MRRCRRLELLALLRGQAFEFVGVMFIGKGITNCRTIEDLSLFLRKLASRRFGQDVNIVRPAVIDGPDVKIGRLILVRFRVRLSYRVRIRIAIVI